MSQQSLYHSSLSSSQMNEPTYPFEVFQTPMKKQMQRSQRIHSQSEQQTIQKYNLPQSQQINVKEQDFRITPKPQRNIVLYDQNKYKFHFPVFKDKQIGIPSKFSNLVIESWNDDDKQTSSTQLQRAIDETMNDLYQYIESPNKQFQQDDQSNNQSSVYKKSSQRSKNSNKTC